MDLTGDYAGVEKAVAEVILQSIYINNDQGPAKSGVSNFKASEVQLLTIYLRWS